MLVRCLRNAKDELTASELELEDVAASFGSYDKVPLEKGTSYVVYAVRNGHPDWYFVADESYTYYPFAYPALLFEVIDPSVSRYWFDSDASTFGERTFKEWATDPYFYDSLTDGAEDAVAVFRRTKAAMDMEFPRPDVRVATTHLDDQWVMCPDCDEAWEASSDDALTLCPRCGKAYQNAAWKKTKELR